ncbi:MAG: acyltransferase [Chitinophagaceae bacterium]
MKLVYGKNIQLNDVFFGKKFEFEIVANNYSVYFGKKISFKRYGLICIREGAQLTIGNNVFFNSYISINCHYKIFIGDNCLFGENVKIYDHNHNYKNKSFPIAQQGYCYGEIKIGNNCWIGSNVTILKNVAVGDNVIIGANCVIYKNIASDTIVKNGANIIEEDY